MRKLKFRLLQLVICIAAVALLWMGTGGLDSRASAEDLALAEQSIRRAAVQCYALEGFYPATFDYLQTHYGVQVDMQRFIVHYEYIASNLVPNVTIIER